MKKTYQLLIVLTTLLTASLACARTSNTPTAAPVPTPTSAPSLPAGEISRTLTHDGRERSYILYVPASVDWSKPVPLVFVFHGGTGNARSAIKMSGFNTVADQHGFLVAYPDGTGRHSDDILLTWNAGSCCGYAQEENVDDVGFVRAMAADVQSLVNIDAKRIYAAGMSNGAMLSQRLACEASDLFAAVAPVAGTLNVASCSPTQPISVIEFHGTGDEHVPYEGGYGPKSLVHVDFASVQKSVGFWTQLDGCSSQPQTNSFDDIQHEVWTGCSGSTSVELYTILGGGHSWPGGAWAGQGPTSPRRPFRRRN
jgi:polyhydroxybutyrate depolymerase